MLKIIPSWFDLWKLQAVSVHHGFTKEKNDYKKKAEASPSDEM